MTTQRPRRPPISTPADVDVASHGSPELTRRYLRLGLMWHAEERALGTTSRCLGSWGLPAATKSCRWIPSLDLESVCMLS